MPKNHKPAWRRILVVTVFSLTLVIGLLLNSGCASSPSPAKGGESFRVMTYNIHHGEGLDGVVDLKRIASVIRKEKPDLVALQEVDRGTERTARRDFPVELAALTGLSCVFSNNYRFQGGEYGNAILSRFPVKSVANHHYRMLRVGEQRGLLQTVVDVKGHELVLFNTHLDHRPDDTDRLASAEELRRVVQRYEDRPMILCGDFNDVPGSRTWQRIAELFQDAWMAAGEGNGFTSPASRPARRIDYLWVTGFRLTPLRLWVPKSDASDHLPVVGDFKFRPRVNQ